MVNQDMHALGSKRSAIRETFEFGRQRAIRVGRENVFDFSLGNPSVPPPQGVFDAFKEILARPNALEVHGYTSAPGSDEARDAIARALNRRFGTSFSRKNLYLTCGAAAALTMTFKALTLSPETEFVAIAPYFPEYACFANTAGAKLRVVEADTQHFQIDFSRLEAALSERTQGVILNSPNNPSGAICSVDTLRALASLLRRKSASFGHPIYLISDEPYRELRYLDGPAPFVTQYYENSIVCYSYSKSLSMPGERIGYVLADDRMDTFNEVCDAIAGAARSQGYVCAPSLMQHVAALCDENDVRPDLTAYRRNRDTLFAGLTESGYRCVPPDGAFYLFVEAPGGDADAFCQRAKQRDVLLVSGRSFGCPTFFRMSYCVSHATIERALPHMRALFEEARI